MHIVYFRPDTVDDAISRVQSERLKTGETSRLEVEVEFDEDAKKVGASTIAVYDLIKDYVESYPDMVLLTYGKKLIFKSNCLEESDEY